MIIYPAGLLQGLKWYLERAQQCLENRKYEMVLVVVVVDANII